MEAQTNGTMGTLTARIVRYSKSQLSAAGIKKGLKLYGVSVLRCRQSKEGVLVAVSPESKAKALNFFSEFELKSSPIMAAGVVSSGSKYIDFGTLFNFVQS